MQVIQLGRRGLLAAACAIFLGSAMPGRTEDAPAAIKPVQDLIAGLVEVMKAGAATSFEKRVNLLGPVIDRTFDLQAILEESVGPTWATLPANQKQMLADAFRRYTVASYVNSFDEFSGQRFEVSPNTRAVGGQQVVQTKVIPRTGDSHELDYVMRQTGGGWRVVDVLADGAISRVAVQRSDFRRLMARGGAPALAESLRIKSAALSDGVS
ncbi:MAG TPA: toluene tolerance protein [Acetobacteraceae bacterium]|jgi:phospholipid transport system substrate-binding protein|nr:toluene tolerance protein [Acetobacteraceae bacterium]